MNDYSPRNRKGESHRRKNRAKVGNPQAVDTVRFNLHYDSKTGKTQP